MKRSLLTGILLACAVSAPVSASEPATNPVIAEVGDQRITFGEINTMLNSSAVVGLSIPSLGTPARDTVRITLLDKMISANLLYLDALAQELDQDPDYRHKIERFERAMLSDLYFRHTLVDPIEVSQQEVDDFYAEYGDPESELTDEGRVQIEAKMRTEKLKVAKTELLQNLHAGADIETWREHLITSEDSQRSPDTVLARVNGESITWQEAADAMMAATIAATRRDPLAMEQTVRVHALERMIDKRLLAQKARAMQLDQDPRYLQRVEEYTKTNLINRQRARLAEQFEPDADTLDAYYVAERDKLMIPAARKIQEVVLATRDEAERIKTEIENAKLTLWQAAAEHSIAPEADKTLGEIGWVIENRALPDLNEVIFSLKAGQIGGPVESPVGWHLIKVVDLQEAQYDNIDDPATRRHVRRVYIHEKLDEHVIALRKDSFDVVLHEDRLIELAQNEADTVAQLTQVAQQDDSVTQRRLAEFQQMMNGGGI